MDYDPNLPWYHGSPEALTTLRTGSTITQDRRLAEVFSHKPPLVCISDDGEIKHNGRQTGYLYRVVDQIAPGDVRPVPRSTMAPGLEWLTTRELRVELVGPVPLTQVELLTDAEVADLYRRKSAGS
jgi:hypothetical protein